MTHLISPVQPPTHTIRNLFRLGIVLTLGILGSETGLEPAHSQGSQAIKDLAAGSQSTCILRADGGINCWGVALVGTVPGITTGRMLSAKGPSTCSLLASGDAVCWTTQDPTPQAVEGISAAISISVGQEHRCALHQLGSVHCWGSNLVGQIGSGPWVGIMAESPTEVSLIRAARSITTGSRHSCAVLPDTTVACWGATWTGNGSYQPHLIEGMWGVTTLAAGDTFTCGLLSDGRVPCWGSDEFGQLGNGVLPSSGRVVLANGIQNAVAITAGLYHACALLEDGNVRCWGANTLGQLGNGSHRSSPIPVAVQGIEKARLIAAGDLHTCAVLEDDQVRCWGANDRGQLGDGSQQTQTLPVTVPRSKWVE